MHPNHQPLPYFARLDDARVVEREKPGRAALSAVSAHEHTASRDPLLLDLAADALGLPLGGIVMAAATGARTTIDPPSGGGLALIGLRCPPGTAAVAASAPCDTVWPDEHVRSGVLAWAANRQGDSLAMFRKQPSGGGEILSAVAGTLLDGALLALGCDTPPCPLPAVWFPDGVFLHRVTRLLNRHDGRCTRRPLSWDSLSLLYPLNGSGEPLPSCLTRHLRQDFHARNTWSSLRHRVVELPASAPSILPGLTPEVADWLDDGSFARWVLSRVPDVVSALEWLKERVDDALASDLSLALGEVHAPGGATS